MINVVEITSTLMGGKGGGLMLCNYREGYVYEDSWCQYHVTDPKKNNKTCVQGE